MSAFKTIGIILFAVLLIVFLFTDQWKLSPSSSNKPVGTITQIKASVLINTPPQTRFEKAKQGQPIFSGSRIISGFSSSATIDFGVPFSLFENSSVRLDQVDGHFEVHLLAGRIKVKKPNLVTHFFVNGERQTDQEITTVSTPQLSNLKVEKLPSNNLNTLYQQDKALQQSIRETFKLHQRFMEKCFIKHYERKRGQTQSGILVVRFELQKNGRIKKPDIEQSDFDDPLFEDCMKEVVSRARIKYYNGERKSVQFPIQVNLPH